MNENKTPNAILDDNHLEAVTGGRIEPYQGEYAPHCAFFEKKDWSGEDLCDNCREWQNDRCSRHRYSD